MLSYLKKLSKEKPKRKKISEQVTYFTRNKAKMKYAQAKTENLMIGSGIVEAACKTVVGERLKRSGMQWNYEGAQSILSFRAASRSRQYDMAFDLVSEKYQGKVIPLRKIKRGEYQPVEQKAGLLAA